MAVPRNRHSNARKNSKRAHHAKEERHFVACGQCGEKKLAHAVCHSCGQYKTRVVLSSENA